MQPDSADRSLGHQPSLGFRSVVHQAFDRRDDSSVPPTPISRDNSQSQHGSDTAGISPIMSRVPSSSAPDSRARAAEARDASVPPIAEESSQPATPDVGSPPSHSRNTSAGSIPASFTPGYRRSLDPPSQEGSPGRTPELEFTKRLSHPMTAETAHVGASGLLGDASDQLASSDPVKKPSTDYASRESDLAETASTPGRKSFGVSQAAQNARSQFLNAHSPVSATSPTFPKPNPRTASPSPGRQSPGGTSRVRELAGQYDHIQALSRTNSSLSSRSRSSIQSWERSDENLALNQPSTSDTAKSGSDDLSVPRHDHAAAPETPSRPENRGGHSFRPHLPGEWVSYVSSAETANSEDASGEDETTPRKADFSHVGEQSSLKSPVTPRSVSQESETVDLTPTTAKQKLSEAPSNAKETGPIDAVKAAGDALGSALMASIGLGGGHDSRDFAQPDKPAEAPSVVPQDTQRRSIGDVYMRPRAESPAASSVASSVAPTPVSKDTPKAATLSEYFPQQISRVQSDAYSTDDSPVDTESDRLRREIENQLKPQLPLTPNTVEQRERDQAALDGPANLRELQVENNLPVPKISVPDFHLATTEPTPETSSRDQPGLLGDRFSWEKPHEPPEPRFATEDTEPRMPYERPLSSHGLHIVNTNISSDSESEPAHSVHREATPPPAPILESTLRGTEPLPSSVSPTTTSNAHPTTEGQSRDVSALSSPSMLPQQSEQLESVSPEPIAEPSETVKPFVANTSTTVAEASRIPPFREILALNSPAERISKYDETRTQFATMDTGLSTWLSATLAANPEHAHAATVGPDLNLATSATNSSIRRKVTGPNIMKIARNLGPSKDSTFGSSNADTNASTSSAPARQPSVSGTERMQAKGKDFMKSAGMFGGKASIGAKGLFAKAKGKLKEGGSEKVD